MNFPGNDLHCEANKSGTNGHPPWELNSNSHRKIPLRERSNLYLYFKLTERFLGHNYISYTKSQKGMQQNSELFENEMGGRRLLINDFSRAGCLFHFERA